jgi:WD40 repeat protein
MGPFFLGLICSFGGSDAGEAAKLQSCWSDLGSLDGAAAYRAIWQFAAEPDATLSFFEKLLAPVRAPDPKVLARLVSDLQSEQFATRTMASAALQKLGPLAMNALVEERKKNLPLDSQRRVATLLKRLNGPKSDKDSLRSARAVEILEIMGSERAKSLLKKCAAGAAGAILTEEARATLERFAKRPPHSFAPIKQGAVRDVDGEPLPANAVARLGTRRFRIPSEYLWAQPHFTPHQNQVAMSDGEGIRVFDPFSGKVARQFEGLLDLTLSPDGKTLVTRAETNKDGRAALIIRDWPSRKQVGVIRYLDKKVTPSALGFVGPKKLLTTNSDNTLRLFDLDTKKETLQKTLNGDIAHAQISPDGSLVLIYRDKHTLDIWEWQTDKPPRRLKLPAANFGARISPDGKILATIHERSFTRLWDLSTGRLLHRLPWSKADDAFNALAFSADSKTLAMTHFPGRDVILWDMDTGKRKQTLPGLARVRSLVFSPDGKQLAGASVHGLQVWDLQSGTLRQKDLGHFAAISTLEFDASGSLIASIAEDGTARLWEGHTGKQLHVLRHEAQGVRALSFAPRDHRLATSACDDTVRLWDTKSGRQIFKLKGHGHHGGGQRRLAFTSDGHQVLSWGDDFYLRAFDVKTGKAVVEHRVIPKGATIGDEDNVQFPFGGLLAPHGRFCAHFDLDGDFTFYDIRTAKAEGLLNRKGSLPLISVPVVSPDRKYLLIAPVDLLTETKPKEYSLEIWHLPSRRLFHTVSTPGFPYGLSWAPDGRSFAALHDGKVTIFETASGQVRFTLGNTSTAAAFSPDGRFLAVGLADTTALVIDLAKAAQKANTQICNDPVPEPP